MAENQRKIELQSPEDLRYLINNAKRAASEKIDRAFPPMANQGEDAMKIRVQELVDEYITQTFTSASANISINGHPAPLSLSHDTAFPILTQEEYEPLNSKLQDRSTELARKEEDLLIEIASLRREAPVAAVSNLKTSFREGVEADEEVVRRLVEGVRAGVGKGGMELGDGDVGGGGGGEEWKRGVEELGRLRDELPGTAGRLEKAKRAGEYVVGERGR